MSAGDRIAVFCGAGASVPSGIPMMSTFLDEVRKRHLNDDQERLRLDAIVMHVRRIASLIGDDARNLESIASCLAAIDYLSPESTIDGIDPPFRPGEALSFIKILIRRACGPQLKQSDASINVDSILKLATQHQLTLITTNYDLTLELVARRTKPACYSPRISSACNQLQNEAGKKTQPLTLPPDSSRPHLLKLHGSINWFQSEDRLAVQNQLVPLMNPEYRQARDWQIQETCPDGFSLDDLLLLAPTVLKPSMGDALREQWQLAHSAIRSADRLWFVGYSFPPSDAFTRHFLGAAIAGNPSLKQIVLIDPYAHTLRPRLESIFSLPEHRNILHIVPLPLEYCEFSHLSNDKVEEAVLARGKDYLAIKAERSSYLRSSNP